MESLTEEKSERMRVDAKWCERISSDKWRTRSDNVDSAKSKENEEKGVGCYRWSARKTKRHFDPRYEPFDEWHMSCALNASTACQTSVVLTVSRAISHRPNAFNTVNYKYQTVTILIVSPSTQYSQSSPWLKCHRSHIFLFVTPMNIEPSILLWPSPQLSPLHKKRRTKWGEGGSWRG